MKPATWVITGLFIAAFAITYSLTASTPLSLSMAGALSLFQLGMYWVLADLHFASSTQ